MIEIQMKKINRSHDHMTHILFKIFGFHNQNQSTFIKTPLEIYNNVFVFCLNDDDYDANNNKLDSVSSIFLAITRSIYQLFFILLLLLFQ